MATTLHSPMVTPTTSTPPTPPSNFPAFRRLPSGSSPGISRNASTSSSGSTTTVSSTSSSLVAAPMRPPPIETSTAATPSVQLPSRPESAAGAPSSPGAIAGYHTPQPQGVYGGRGFMRNGPRSRQGTLPLPAIVTSDPDFLPSRASSTPLPAHAPHIGLSPTTPRASHFADPDELDGQGPFRVTISSDAPHDLGHGNGNGNGNSYGYGSGSSSPRSSKGLPSPTIDRKGRTLSVGAGQGRDASRDRERRQSQASAKSAASGRVRETPRDYVFGEELGRGSYSTVVQAIKASSSTASPTSPRPPKQYAIKIINQAHLVQEKKTKYAMIERDALVRLSAPRSSLAGANGSSSRGHRRGISSSSSGGYTVGAARNRKSTASIGSITGAAVTPGRQDSNTLAPGDRAADRLGVSVNTVISDSGSSTALGSSVPLSPVLAGRRPSRSAEPPEVVPERSEDGDHQTIPLVPSRPPSPVAEEPREAEELTPPRPIGGWDGHMFSSALLGSPDLRSRDLGRGEDRERTHSTPSARRQSQALSERSLKSTKGGLGQSHPGVIRLYSTFNDATSLYFVLDLASNGELLSFIRKYGSLDIVSTRYYAAQLIDTIEFMHERGVIHRDLKPENILLDEEMRIKITDFGSAKLLNKDAKDRKETSDTDRKRSFVGSADFVSPEVLRNEPASMASDIWAFGCILYQLVVGRPPFRGATDYLTFQKILKRDMEYPHGFDEEAKTLVEQVFKLDPSLRAVPAVIKTHPFFSSIEWSTLWTSPAPRITTGLAKPVATLATVEPDSDIWAVFEDEVSDGGFPYEDEEDLISPGASGRPRSPPPPHTLPRPHEHRGSPLYDSQAAAEAVASVDRPGYLERTGTDVERLHQYEPDLEPPRPAWVEGVQRKRGWSRGSHRTSSSGSGNRMALAGLLETMGIQQWPGSNRGSRTSNSIKSDDARPASRGSGKVVYAPQGQGEGGYQEAIAESEGEDERHHPFLAPEEQKWATLLLANERILFTSPVHIRSSALPHFLAPAPKKRQLILTDFPRLIAVKEEVNTAGGRPSSAGSASGPGATSGGGGLSKHDPSSALGQEMAHGGPARFSVKSECVFVGRPSTVTVGMDGTNGMHGTGGSTASALGGAVDGGTVNRVVDVVEKGSKGFVVQTAGHSYPYIAATPDLRSQWIAAIKHVPA